MIRKAKAVWRSMGRDGNGDLSLPPGCSPAGLIPSKPVFENEKAMPDLKPNDATLHVETDNPTCR
jgi:hypothetical protein